MFTFRMPLILDLDVDNSSLCKQSDQVPLPSVDFPSRMSSPTGSSAHSSSSACGEDDADGEFDVQIPALFVTPSRDHYEVWDARPQERFCMGGSLYLGSDHIVLRTGAYLHFSHVELEVRTHGRQGRFSRENIWRPSYLDYASTPIAAPPAQHLTRTREKSLVTFARMDDGFGGAIRLAYRIEVPQELFWAMRTRSLRITCRAIFLEWQGQTVVSTEVVEADPVCVTVSHLQMRDYLGPSRCRGIPTRSPPLCW